MIKDFERELRKEGLTFVLEIKHRVTEVNFTDFLMQSRSSYGAVMFVDELEKEKKEAEE